MVRLAGGIWAAGRPRRGDGEAGEWEGGGGEHARDAGGVFSFDFLAVCPSYFVKF